MFDLQFLNDIRQAELTVFRSAVGDGAAVLEIGGGTGEQARMLASMGVDVVTVDLAGSTYAADRVFDVIDYDGRTLPFADRSFDIVFSSNVLEHIEDLERMHGEIRRVLRPGGKAIHILPTPSWRVFTTLTHYLALGGQLARGLWDGVPKRLALRELTSAPLRSLRTVLGLLKHGALPPRHGERGNVLTEMEYFRPSWWRQHFHDQGFEVIGDQPVGLFYTGTMLAGKRLSLPRRKSLARYLGSACHLFELQPRAR